MPDFGPPPGVAWQSQLGTTLVRTGSCFQQLAHTHSHNECHIISIMFNDSTLGLGQSRIEYLFDKAGLQLDPTTVASFWRDARSNGVPWALSVCDGVDRVPLKIFGDDARYGKKSGEQIYAIFISCPLFRPRCARQSRWLLWSLRSELFLGTGGQNGYIS